MKFRKNHISFSGVNWENCNIVKDVNVEALLPLLKVFFGYLSYLIFQSKLKYYFVEHAKSFVKIFGDVVVKEEF